MWLYIILGFLIYAFIVVVVFNLNGFNAFQKLVILVSLGVLTFVLSMIANIITNNKTLYNAISGACPDYWAVDNTTDKTLCIIPKDGRNVGNLDVTDKSIIGYNANIGAIDFTNSQWNIMSVNDGETMKKKWANKNNIWWDGITNLA